MFGGIHLTRLARQILRPRHGVLQLRVTTKMHAGENVEVIMNVNYVGDRLAAFL